MQMQWQQLVQNFDAAPATGRRQRQENIRDAPTGGVVGEPIRGLNAQTVDRVALKM
ncbi:hypothetical protein D9M72_656710 [compost metagenome]